MGARFQRILIGMALSFELDIEYIHVPMAYEGFGITQSMGNSVRTKGYPQSESVEYLRLAHEWDNAVKYSGKKITDIDLLKFNLIKSDQSVMYNQLIMDIKNNNTEGKIYLFDSLHRLLWNKIINKENIVRHQDKLISLFSLNIEPTNEIVVHIRRKDIVKYPFRMLDDDYYLKLLDVVSNKFGNENIIITTQRENFNSNKYSKYTILYDDECSEINTFKRMVNSKLLIIALSSFSISAAYLNKGIIIVPQKLKLEEKLNHWKYEL
jgi:hypothetical protein